MALDKYQFTIEDTIIQNPEGWKDFELRLKRDEDISGLLVSSTNKFTFKGDGYTILHDRWLSNYNDKIEVSIDILQSDNTYKQQYSGVVILTDVKFNLEKFTAEATIEDSSFQGAIQGNKNIKSFLNAGLTKNGEQVSAPPQFELNYFSQNGSYNPVQLRTHFRVKDALDFLVRFMTDDEVKGIQSAYLDDTTNWEGFLPYITTGGEIRLGTELAPNISFLQLISFLQNTHDLTFDFVTDSNGDPVMRIEERTFFFNASPIDIIRDITDLSVRVDSNRIASHLEVGNNTTFGSGNCSTTTRFFSFQKEDYSLRGKGNVDKLLDLTTDFITDSNVIEEIVDNNDDTFDDNIIIVLGDSSAQQAAQFQTPDFCSNNFFYNQGFLNNFIIDRQLESIPNSITKYLTAATTPSKAEPLLPISVFINTANPISIVLTQINSTDESYDLGNNYSTVDPNNTFYDIPFAGKFSFEVSVDLVYTIGTTGVAGGNVTLNPQMFLQRFDSSFTLPPKEIIPAGKVISISGNVGKQNKLVFTIPSTMECDTGDRIRLVVATATLATVAVASVTLDIIKTGGRTFFKCLGADNDAGTYKTFDTNTFKARLYTFVKNLPLARTDNIRANPRSSLIINELSDTALDKEVWIEEMVNNIETGDNSFTMIN